MKKTTTDDSGDSSLGKSKKNKKNSANNMNTQEILSYVFENPTQIGNLFYWEFKAG